MTWYTSEVSDEILIHPTADVSPRASIGAGSRIWHGVQIREDVTIGRQCILGKNVYIDYGVPIGDRCKIQNNASIFHGASLESGVFVGPHACITNDLLPRAITPDGALKGSDDWELGRIVLRYGCSIGAGAIVLPNVTVGSFALVGAGAIVTRSVPAYGLVVGNPARLIGYVCPCGGRLRLDAAAPDSLDAAVSKGKAHATCTRCERSHWLDPQSEGC